VILRDLHERTRLAHPLTPRQENDDEPARQDRAARPKARAILERDCQGFVFAVVPAGLPVRDVAARPGRRGVDGDGNRFLDFAAGIAVWLDRTLASRGWCGRSRRPPTASCHISSDYWHEGQVRLGERIAAALTDEGAVMSFFAQSGTRERGGPRSRLARHVTGAAGSSASWRASTAGPWARSPSRPGKHTQQQGFFADHAGVTHVPYPNSLPAALRRQRPGPGGARTYIENVLFPANLPPSEVCGGPGRAASRGKAGTSSRPTASWPGSARSATGTGSCSSSTRFSAGSDAPGGCSPPSIGVSFPTSSRWPRARLGAPESGWWWPRRASWRSGRKAPTATPTAATRCAARPPSPPWILVERE